MSKNSIFITLCLTLATLASARDTGTASVNSVDYGSAQPKAAAPTTTTAPAPTSEAEFNEPPEKAVQVVPLSSVPANFQGELEAKTDEYESRKTKALIFGIIGTGLLVAGDIMINIASNDITRTNNSNGYYNNNSSSSSSSDDQLLLDGLVVFIAGIPFQVIGTVNMIHAIIKGSQLRNYENETGYRLSFKPLINPRTGQAGMMASLEF
jgi:hypothetical protein